ncbi:hypothetical protein LAZ67_5001907 [Cordylochernes scorpioides]|uniref:Transposase n=1 Tax=Cordylochernes scorpioides TaxID=51811 RepID=A0ABY6KJ15_9ARAC|nr:hypothetical protein LAZ67_5001907 [Cordylochernes scorpioides]
MIQNDRNISIRVISAKLNLSYGSGQKSIAKHLKYRKICTRWVPRLLTKEMKEKRYEIEGEGFLDRQVTGNESWIHHHLPDSKRSNAELHHKGSPTPKKPRIAAFAGKVLLTIFWVSKGCILEDYLPKDQTVNSIVYSELLEKN